MKSPTRVATVVVTAVLLCAFAYAQQPPPEQIPLGDVAKQKAAKKAKKVVTEDDMPARPPEPIPAAAASVSGANDGQRSGDTAMGAVAKAAPPNVSPEQARQNKIEELKGYEEAAKRIISKMEANLADPNLPDNRRQVFSDALAAGRQRLELLTREREALERQGTAPKPPQATQEQ